MLSTTQPCVPRPTSYASVDPSRAAMERTKLAQSQPQPTGSGSWSGPGAAASANTADRTSLEDFIAGLSGSYLMGMDGDLAFIVMCEQIKDADRRIRGMMSEIRSVGAVRDAISKHIDRLRELENKMKRLNNDKDVNAAHCWRWENGDHHNELMTEYQDLRYRPDFATAPDGGGIVRTVTKTRIGTTEVGACLDDIAKELKYWETKAQELDQNREIKLVELNSLISKRANWIQLLSNMQKNEHDTEAGVISKIG